jgi:hypothetical protein
MVRRGSTKMPKKLSDEVVNAAIDGFTAQRLNLTSGLRNSEPCSTVVPLRPPPSQNQHNERAEK